MISPSFFSTLPCLLLGRFYLRSVASPPFLQTIPIWVSECGVWQAFLSIRHFSTFAPYVKSGLQQICSIFQPVVIYKFNKHDLLILLHHLWKCCMVLACALFFLESKATRILSLTGIGCSCEYNFSFSYGDFI